jgi:hypothetical protein
MRQSPLPLCAGEVAEYPPILPRLIARFLTECLALAIVGAAFGAPALFLLYGV